MAGEKRRKTSRLKKILSRNVEIEPERSGGGESPKSPKSALRELMELPVDLSIEPLSAGKEMTRFLEERLGISSESLVLIGGALDPLLLESRSIPPKVIRKGTEHDGDCPVTTGSALAVRKAGPEMFCRVCNPEFSLGEAVLRLPLEAGGRIMGVLTLNFREWPALLDDNDFLAAFSRRTCLEFKAIILTEMNRLLEITDNLTRVYNYRYFIHSLETELERSRRYDHQFTLLLADLEKFQQFNRRFGYAAGDVMLREVARRLRASVRSTDIVARYSGQQFALILTETDRKGGDAVMEKIEESVTALKLKLPESEEDVGVRVVVGRATFPRDATISSRLVTCAEDSLMQAKSGK